MVRFVQVSVAVSGNLVKDATVRIWVINVTGKSIVTRSLLKAYRQNLPLFEN